MMKEPRLRVHVEYGELQADFAGDPEAVSLAFIDFLYKVYPSFKLAHNLVFKPDLVKLSQALEGVIEYSSEGMILLPETLTSEEAILLSLLGVYVGNQLRFFEEAALSVNDVANTSGKAPKTILNQLKGMIDDGLVERAERGKYRIKSRGIKAAEKILRELTTR